MLCKLLFKQQFIRNNLKLQYNIPMLFLNPTESFSMINYHIGESILPPEERPNYYNVYDDDEIFEVDIENESPEVTQNKHHNEDSSEVFNSTFDDEIF